MNIGQELDRFFVASLFDQCGVIQQCLCQVNHRLVADKGNLVQRPVENEFIITCLVRDGDGKEIG